MNVYEVIYASGHVQGVGFRATTLYTAKSLGIVGYVKNLSDGRVLVEAVGTEQALESLRQMLESIPGDGETTLDTTRKDVAASFSEFEVRR